MILLLLPIFFKTLLNIILLLASISQSELHVLLIRTILLSFDALQNILIILNLFLQLWFDHASVP